VLTWDLYAEVNTYKISYINCAKTSSQSELCFRRWPCSVHSY